MYVSPPQVLWRSWSVPQEPSEKRWRRTMWTPTVNPVRPGTTVWKGHPQSQGPVRPATTAPQTSPIPTVFILQPSDLTELDRYLSVSTSYTGSLIISFITWYALQEPIKTNVLTMSMLMLFKWIFYHLVHKMYLNKDSWPLTFFCNRCPAQRELTPMWQPPLMWAAVRPVPRATTAR